MKIDLEKIKKLPPDVRKEFMKTFLQLQEKKKIGKIKSDFLSFVKLLQKNLTRWQTVRSKD